MKENMSAAELNQAESFEIIELDDRLDTAIDPIPAILDNCPNTNCHGGNCVAGCT